MLGKPNKNILFDFLTQAEFRIWRHLFFILAFFPIGLAQAFFALQGSAEISTGTIYGMGIFLSLTIIAFVYFNIYFLAERFLPDGQYASYLIALLLSVFGFLILKDTVEYFIFADVGIIRESNWVGILNGLSNLMLYSICIASGAITLLFKRWMEGNQLIESLEIKQLRNSIEEIKNSVQPAFLYATLSYASEKVKSDPEQASDTLFRLSELLRYQLYDSKREKVLLDADIQFIRNYLTVKEQHAQGNFLYAVSVLGNTNVMIPTALFMPWIEEITQHNPQELQISFEIDTYLIKFNVCVQGMDLSRCNFAQIAEKLTANYADDLSIEQGFSSLILVFRIC